MTERIFYVYQYIDETGNPFYIGKGKGNRIHCKHRFELPAIEKREIIASNLTETEAFELEMQLIRLHGRKVDGGLLENIKLNQWACAIGWKHSEETKRIISEKNRGRTLSEETKQKMRKPKSPEHVEKIRLANLGRKDDGRAAKSSATLKGKPWSEARRAAQMRRQKLKEQTNGMA